MTGIVETERQHAPSEDAAGPGLHTGLGILSEEYHDVTCTGHREIS